MNLTTPLVRRWIENGILDPEDFWEQAARELPWFRTWDQVYESDAPSFRWFVGARTNISHNAVDRHVADGKGGQAALLYVNERNERVVLTYAQLQYEVKRVAAALRGLGIKKGDRVTLSMPTCPEAVILMLWSNVFLVPYRVRKKYFRTFGDLEKIFRNVLPQSSKIH